MSLASIIKKIDEDATAQSQEIIEQARIEDTQITTYARLKAEEEAKELVEHAEQELQTLKNKQMATTLLRMRKEKLDNRQRILSEVFDAVVQQVNSFDDKQRLQIVKTILLSVSEERKGSVILSKPDKKLVDRSFIAEINAELEKQKRKLQFTLSNKTAAIERGFLVDFRDFEINYSIEMLLSSLWEELKGEVSAQLFEGE